MAQPTPLFDDTDAPMMRTEFDDLVASSDSDSDESLPPEDHPGPAHLPLPATSYAHASTAPKLGTPSDGDAEGGAMSPDGLRRMLRAAAEGGDVEGVAAALATGLDCRPSHGDNVMCAAARGGSAQVILLLANAGGGLDTKDKRGYTPLMYAAEAGHLAAAVQLLDLDALLDLSNPEGHTALHIALLKHNASVAAAILGRAPSMHDCPFKAGPRTVHDLAMAVASSAPGYTTLMEALAEAERREDAAPKFKGMGAGGGKTQPRTSKFSNKSTKMNALDKRDITRLKSCPTAKPYRTYAAGLNIEAWCFNTACAANKNKQNVIIPRGFCRVRPVEEEHELKCPSCNKGDLKVHTFGMSFCRWKWWAKKLLPDGSIKVVDDSGEVANHDYDLWSNSKVTGSTRTSSDVEGSTSEYLALWLEAERLNPVPGGGGTPASAP